MRKFDLFFSFLGLQLARLVFDCAPAAAACLGNDTTTNNNKDPLVALQEWERQADLKSMRVQRYYPKAVPHDFYVDSIYNFYEPDGRCVA